MKTKQYFIRSKGKGEFKTFHLIEKGTYNMLDDFFSTEEEAIKFAKSKSLEIITYDDSTEIGIRK